MTILRRTVNPNNGSELNSPNRAAQAKNAATPQLQARRSSAKNQFCMIRISITAQAFEAISSTMPLGAVAYEAETTADGGRFIWIDRQASCQLDAMRRGDESYSDVILRISRLDATRRGRRRNPLTRR